jgi:hypothetical protein
MMDILHVEKREATGLEDIEGTEIFTGDIVEFYFNESRGYSSQPKMGFVRMHDIVNKINGKIYFCCAFGGCYAYRAVDYCKVIGNDPALIDT